MLDDLDDDALDRLPYGVICLNPALTVLRMNRAESERSGIQRWRARGRDFLADVAPGEGNQRLAETVRAFVAGRAPAQPITHTFPRRAGADPTTIELCRGRDASHIYLCIHRGA